MGKGTHNHRWRTAVSQLLGIFLGFLTLAGGVVAEDIGPSEQELKAAFLVNFPKCVDWPPEAFATTNSPIVLAIFGEAKFDGDLKRIIGGRTVSGRPLVLRQVKEEAELAGCHVLFIGDADHKRIPALLGRIKTASILTVGGSDDFLEQGGMIRLARRDRKVRLEVNLTAATQANLKISSRLLSLADVVKGTSK